MTVQSLDNLKVLSTYNLVRHVRVVHIVARICIVSSQHNCPITR